MPTTLAHRPGSGAGGVGVNQEDGRTRTPRSTEPSRKRRGAGERGPARIPCREGPETLDELAPEERHLIYRVVLLGSDASADGVSRSDTIVVAKAGGRMLAVLRDTLVQIPGVGEDKINAAFAAGGPDLTVETLENLGELPIGNNVVAHFDGVEDIVNAMGGITLEVEHSIEVGIEGQPISISAGRPLAGGGAGLRPLQGQPYGGYRQDRAPAEVLAGARSRGDLAREVSAPPRDDARRLAQHRYEHESLAGRPLRCPDTARGQRGGRDLPRCPTIHQRHLLLDAAQRGRTTGGGSDRAVSRSSHESHGRAHDPTAIRSRVRDGQVRNQALLPDPRCRGVSPSRDRPGFGARGRRRRHRRKGRFPCSSSLGG
jgi:LCP family protein required for cell wall assembly